MANERKVPDGRQRLRVAEGVYLKPSGKYLATYRDPGRRQQWKEFRTKREAVKWRAVGLSDPQSLVKGRRRLVDVFEGYLEVRSMRPTSEANWRSVWSNHVAPTFGNWPIGKIQVIDVKRYFMALEERGVGAATRAKCRVILHKLFEEAIENREAAWNPIVPSTHVSVPNERAARTLSAEEVASILEVAAARRAAPAGRAAPSR